MIQRSQDFSAIIKDELQSDLGKPPASSLGMRAVSSFWGKSGWKDECACVKHGGSVSRKGGRVPGA
jgi:hypothetical protein